MKNLITTIIVIVLTFTALNAQINNIKVKIPTNRNLNLDPNLNLEKIKGHLKSGDYCYEAQLGTTAIIPPKTGGVSLVPIIGHLISTNIKDGQGQLVVEGSLLSSMYGYAKGDEYTIYISPDSRDKTKIDAANIYILWRLPGERLRDFKLKNVSIQYKPYGIILVGNYEVNGILIGVNMTLTPTACLI